MTRPVRDWDADQSMLRPLSVHDFVPAEHVAHFIRDAVADPLDLKNRQQPGLHPCCGGASVLRPCIAWG